MLLFPGWEITSFLLYSIENMDFILLDQKLRMVKINQKAESVLAKPCNQMLGGNV